MVRISLSGANVQLGNKGGRISLLEPEGVKVHSVAYIRDDVREQGRAVMSTYVDIDDGR